MHGLASDFVETVVYYCWCLRWEFLFDFGSVVVHGCGEERSAQKSLLCAVECSLSETGFFVAWTLEWNLYGCELGGV